MGICKCKKRTDLFCFVHKKAVCESCLIEDHTTCFVRTYVDWLTDSDYDHPACGICKGELIEDKVVRLTCLHTFHPECLDVHASSLPPHTAKAGYLCPICSKCIFPAEIESNPLVKHVQNYLSKAHWARNLLAPPPLKPVSIDMPPTDSKDFDTRTNVSELPVVSKRGVDGQLSSSNQDSFGMSSRKTQLRDYTINMPGMELSDADEEDKYQKRSLTQLFVALGLMKPNKSKSNVRSRVKFDIRRVLIILALVSTLITVFILGSSITSKINTTENVAVDS